MHLFQTLCLILLAILIHSCGQDHVKHDRRTGPNPLQHLEDKVLRLEGTINMINDFVAGDFSSCNTALPPLETKICRIAQTSNADQLVIISGQLRRLTQILQTDLYGADCPDSVSPGCPVTGSILQRLELAEVEIDTVQTAITAIQQELITMQTSLDILEDRLDNFDGSGDSLETVITDLNSLVADLNSRIAALEQITGGSEYYKWVFACHDNPLVTVNEPLLLRGDNKEVRGYVSTVTQNGMGVISVAGVSGHQFLITNTSPKCNLRIYDRTAHLRICWHRTNRTANSALIDAQCDIVTPTANCTCSGL